MSKKSGVPNERQLGTAAQMFGALSDTARLRTLMLLAEKERSVSEVAAAEGEKMTTVSARLQILHAAHLIARQRRGKSIIYSIADEHVLTLIENAVAHASEKR
jgi:ArsR family transcriptional regulator, lead/cadmium/zinc/bismuth-responsive transcriptional repressor